MIVDITNEILDDLKNTLTDVTVKTTYESSDTDFPLVTFTEMSNGSTLDTIDSAGVNHNDLDYEVNIFTSGSIRMSKAVAIRRDVDAILSDKYMLTRQSSDEIPNYGNDKIYRLVIRYNCVVSKDKTIYRR